MTAFSVGEGKFTITAFGLCNAPATFERLMDQVLKGLHWKACLVYFDDIIVLGKSFDEHLKNLEEVFLFKIEISYLGHKVTTEGICTAKEKIEAVKDWPTPKNLHELLSFLGLCTIYWWFVPNFASLVSRFYELTKQNRVFECNKKQEGFFQTLSKRLSTAPMLAYPIPGSTFILNMHVSGFAVGGVLSQVIDGHEKVVAYYSQKISYTERNYCVPWRELPALVKCIKHFHKYLYGQRLWGRIDHAALKWLLQFRNPEGQLARLRDSKVTTSQ